MSIAQEVNGKYCIVRCYAAGVHAGEVVQLDGDKAILRDSRRLWYWVAREGIALSGVAQHGIDRQKSRIDELNPSIYITGVIEVIPCADGVKETING